MFSQRILMQYNVIASCRISTQAKVERLVGPFWPRGIQTRQTKKGLTAAVIHQHRISASLAVGDTNKKAVLWFRT